jgi:hypothetical protein
MTTPTPSASEGAPASAGLPVRTLTAWTLLALAAAVVLFAFLRWIFPDVPRGFVNRFSVTTFANHTILVAPLLAMLIATKLGPALRGVKLMGLLAMATYGAALLFGGLSFLFTIVDKFTGVGGRGAIYGFGAIIQGLGSILVELLLLALLALAALWTYKLHTDASGGKPIVNVRAT